MLETRSISEIEPGIFHMILPQCTKAVLPYVLLPDAPITWVVRHWPHSLGWWAADLPLKAGARPQRVRARDVQFDLEFSTAEFLRLLPEMADHGVILHQMDRSVADTLDYDRLPKRARYRILRDNGWRLSFDQHTLGEYANVVSPDRNALERILAQPVIQSDDLP
jgi:hypothetical protein